MPQVARWPKETLDLLIKYHELGAFIELCELAPHLGGHISTIYLRDLRADVRRRLAEIDVSLTIGNGLTRYSSEEFQQGPVE